MYIKIGKGAEYRQIELWVFKSKIFTSEGAAVTKFGEQVNVLD